MKKLLKFLSDNILFVSTLFLLAFIPLYPKIPLADVKNTWVYIRLEDVFVVLVVGLWIVLFIRKKVSLKTPLTLPIVIFWIAGAIATIHGIVLIFPGIANVFPNVAFLSFMRHIEYMSLFFVAYAGMRDRKFLKIVIGVLVATLLGVIFYGFGQRFLGFKAILTMNEEFAKGVPVQLSELGRIPSTFAGHYDLAAYLVLIIPIVVSLVFGFKNWLVKLFLAGTAGLGFILLFMTVSRVSFFVLFIGLFVVLLFQKRKFVLLSIPLVAVLGVLVLYFSPSLLARFGNTVEEVNVLVDSGTGESIGHVQFVPSSYVAGKFVEQKDVRDKNQLDIAINGQLEAVPAATESGVLEQKLLPETIPLVTAVNVSTGETLPQGTGYINLPLSPVTNKLSSFYYELSPDEAATSAAFVVFHGDFLVKRAAAYDLSFTTRFQGEWPNAMKAFAKNILIGSGYGSVSLAIDNNYFRMLAEVGLLGTGLFFAIFLVVGIYIKKTLPNIDSPLVRSFVIGFVGGVVGLAFNATLIDVFEASKIAFLLWMLTGITLALLVSYHDRALNMASELKKALVSPIAIVIYLFFGTFAMYSPMLSNYFTGDDFTWFRWAADCSILFKPEVCASTVSTIFNYFVDTGGFFYRPGTRTFFLLLYQVVWLNQVVYHVVSLVLYFLSVTLFYFLARRVLRDNLLSAGSAFIFLILSGYSESVFWISSIGYLFNAVFALSAVLLFALWDQKKNILLLVTSLICIAAGLAFHEVGVVVPLFILLYKFITDDLFRFKKILKPIYFAPFIPVVGYFVLRYISGSHWLSGDYSYNFLKLPFNVAGNIGGYLLMILTGPISLSFYESLRGLMRDNLIVGAIVLIPTIALVALFYKKVWINVEKGDKRVLIFGIGFFLIALLPFLGLGNITSRYSFLASMGIVMIMALYAKKLFDFLTSQGRGIAIAIMVLIGSVFILLHVMQVQEIHRDWNGAGNRVKKFLISIDAQYLNYWSSEPMHFHFVNPTIKVGEAWVFPVGMPDALWFAFNNPDIAVSYHSSIDEALSKFEVSRNQRLFDFSDDGSVKEVIPIKKNKPEGSPVSPNQILYPYYE